MHPMTTHLSFAAAVGLLLTVSGAPASAQDPFKYRDYTLGSSLNEMVAIDEPRITSPKTLHTRPGVIQQFAWRAPYTGPHGDDPVRDVVLTFFNDALYQIVVSYERDRTTGLTTEDVVRLLSATYGQPLLRDGRTATHAVDVDVSPDMALVAQWEDAGAVVSLWRSRLSFWPQFQLALVSRSLNAEARQAIVQAQRLDALAAPQRERDRRAEDAAARAVAEQKARETNRATFRP
jgi:hypothetical protein